MQLFEQLFKPKKVPFVSPNETRRVKPRTAIQRNNLNNRSNQDFAIITSSNDHFKPVANPLVTDAS